MGKVIARRLIQDGYQVYAAARSVEKMNHLAQLGARPLRIDISHLYTSPSPRDNEADLVWRVLGENTGGGGGGG
ncbi:hypothetical protein ACVGWG_04970, partial [Enterobacter asburiae]